LFCLFNHVFEGSTQNLLCGFLTFVFAFCFLFLFCFVLFCCNQDEFGYSDVDAGLLYGVFGMLVSVYGIGIGMFILWSIAAYSVACCNAIFPHSQPRLIAMAQASRQLYIHSCFVGFLFIIIIIIIIDFVFIYFFVFDFFVFV
jgi:hypothetical protein